MNENSQALRILGFAALTLSVRILTWCSLVGAMALFGYAVALPSTDRTIAAALFAVLVFLPCVINERRPKQAPRTRPAAPVEEQQYAVNE